MGLFDAIRSHFEMIWSEEAYNTAIMKDAITRQRVSDVVFALVIVCFVVAIIIIAKKEARLERARVAVVEMPNYENTILICERLAAHKLEFTNKPDVWAKWKDTFYVVNGSEKVPTELKIRLKELLSAKGLYIKNMKIIDNFSGNTSQKDEKKSDY